MKRTILLVDDNLVERTVLNGFLKSDYTIIEAENGKQAIEILNKRHKTISAVIMDIIMPGMDGFEALKIIKTNPVWISIPVIITTGLDDDEAREKAIVCGADNFITKPYSRSLLINTIQNAIKLKETAAIANTMWRDHLTGLLNREAFFSEAERMIKRKKAGYYVLACFNVENFKVINDQYGKETGDKVLKHIAECLNESAVLENRLCCRYSSDWFAMLYPAALMDSPELRKRHTKVTNPECIIGTIRVRIGRYLVNDKSVPLSIMFDRASLAESSIKNMFSEYIADYRENMRDALLAEQKIIISMSAALENGEFEPWFQPQYNHATGALVGAEALVRWKKDDKFISPAEFVPVFERNGFIYEMDKYIWEQVCILLRRWLDEGKKPLPISVNISRRDIFHMHFIEVITGIVDKYKIPYDLIRLEITESAMTENSVIDKVGELIRIGFTVEIDDFGSGYSSLNTLKDVPASIIKLDMRFFEDSGNTERGGSIIESVVRMAKWLNMSVIAEGVEEKSQADYLKSIGCYYIQGYFYAKPMSLQEFEQLLEASEREPKLSRLETVATLDSNLFWNPKSMETLIFNSYVGGACIFEYHKGNTEILRVNDQYISEFNGLIPDGSQIRDCSIVRFLNKDNLKVFQAMLNKSDKENKEASCKVVLSNGKQTEYVRYTVRVIARTDERLLYYSVMVNETELHESERKQKESAERLSIIMENVNGGVSAIQIFDNGTSNLIFHNDKYYDLYGYTREQAEANNLDMLSCILPESFPYVMEKVKKLKQDGIPTIIDYSISKADGSVAYIRANCALMEMEGYDNVIVSVLVDVTEQRTLQDQLRAIVDNINGGVTAIRYENGVPELLLINENYYDIIGYTKTQFETEIKDIFQIIYPDDRARIEKLFSRATEDQMSYTMEYRILRRNGAVRHILCNTSIMRLFGIKEPVQLSVINDITTLREVQQKEHNLSVQMDTIMKNIGGGITATVFHDKDNVEIVFANDGYYELYGYTKEQFESEVVNALDLILPEDREKIMETVAKTVRERSSVTYEYRCHRRDGSIIWTQTTNAVIAVKGIGDSVLLSITTDITGLRRAEEQSREWADRLKAVMNAMTNGITAVTFNDNKLKYLFANDRFYAIHGTVNDNNSQVMLSSAFEMIHPDDRERIHDVVMNTTQIGQSAEEEYRVILPDGTMCYVEVEITVTNLMGIDEPVQVAIFSDITAEKKANMQLHFLNESARGIITEPDVDKAINDTICRLVAYFNADRGYIVEIDTEKMQTSNTYEFCVDGVIPQKDNLQFVPLNTKDMWYQTLSRDEFVIIPNVNELDNSERELQKMLLVQEIDSIIIAPLTRDGRLIGFLGVDNPHNSIEQAEQLTALSDYVSILLKRRDMEKKIEQDTKTVQQLINDTPGGFLRMEVFEGKNPAIVSFNDGFCNLLSMTRDEVMTAYGDDAFKCLLDEDIITVSADSAKALADCGQFTSKCRLRRADDSFIWVMFFGRFVHDENSKTYLNSYFTDITEKLKEEDNQKSLLDNLPFGAAMYEFDGSKLTVSHINKKYWQQIGRLPVDYTNALVIDMVHPDDRQILMQELLSAIRQNRDLSVDIRVKGDLNNFIPFHITANIVKTQGNKSLLYVCYDPISNDVMSLQEMLPIALSTIVSNTEDISYVKDKDLRYICVSQAVADMVGANNPRDLVGKTAREVFSNKFSEKFDADDKNVIETGKTVLRKLEHIPTPDGGVCLARTSKFPILDSQGRAVGVYCVSRDITAQKEKESQLELMADSIPGGLAAYSISDDGFKTLYFNDGYYDYSGYTREEYVKIAEQEPLALILEEDRTALLSLVRKFAKDKKDGLRGECSYRCLTKDGEIRYMSMKAVLSQVGEKHFVLNVVQLDITTQIQAERKQIELLDNLPFGAGLYEYDGKSLTAYHINKQYEKMVNRNENSSNTNRLPIDYIHPDDRAIITDEIRDAIANHRYAYKVVRILCSDGEYLPFRIGANIENVKNGKYRLFVAFARISEEQQNFEKMLPHIFDTIMESSTDLSFAKDINYRYIRCSKTFADILGLDNEKNVIGKTDYELFPKEVADRFRRDDATLFTDGKPQIDISESIPSPDGTMHYTRTSKHLLRDAAGNAIGVYCIGRDVTEVREAFSQLSMLTNTIPGGIATFRCSPGNINTLYFSDGISKLVGYTREEYQRDNISLLTLVFDEDRGVIKEQIELMMNGEINLDFTFRIHTNGGGYKWISANAHVTERVDDIFTVSAVLTDVTEAQEEREQLRRTEEEYRIAASHSNRTICRYLIKEKQLHIAPEASERFNLPAILNDIPYGEDNLKDVSEDSKENYLRFFNDIIDGNKECSGCFKKHINNNWCWLDVRATTVFDDFGKPVSAIISYADITEQREKEAIYCRWQNSLYERSEDSYTLFRANLSKGISYDSRSGGLLDIDFSNAERSFDELTGEYIEKRVYADDREHYRAFLRADTMLAEYMRGHRSESIEYREFMPNGQIRWLKLSVDLVKYPDSDDVEVYLMFENIDAKKKLELRTIERAETDALTGLLNRSTFAVRVNKIIGASAPGVHHALLMLDIDGFKMVNDIFGHAAGDEALTDIADLLTKTTRHEDLVGRLGGDEFLVFISNIPDDETVVERARKLCEITRKTFNADVRISASIGIAMYPQDGEGFESLYKVADQMLYHVKDAGKDGYSFSHKLPVTELEINSTNRLRGQPVIASPKHRRMLIVDDNKIDRKIISGFFEKEFNIEHAADGATAIKILRYYGTAISVVLLDLVMPGIDGYEVLRKMQEAENTRTIPVIVVSADSDRETALSVIRAGATDLITKPVDAELLSIRVEAAVSRAENERLRAQNSFLSLRNTETGSFRAALEYSGIIVITLDWITGDFLYSPGIEMRLAGKYDGRAFWRILLSNMVTDVKTVQKMQQLVHDLSADRERHDNGCNVRLKTPSGISHMFDFRVFKENNDYGLADKMIITLREIGTKND